MHSIKIISLLQSLGWICVRQTGSHNHFKHPEIKGLVTIPHPVQTLPKGTLKSIIRQAQIKIPLDMLMSKKGQKIDITTCCNRPL